MATWNNDDKIKELKMVKECVSLILKQKEIHLTSGQMNELEFTMKMESIFPSFIKNYSAIYKMIVRNNDINILYKMLDELFSVCNGKKDFDEVRNKMGDDLANKYIPKHLGSANKN